MSSSTPLSLDRARFNMIEQQVRPWEVLDPAVLELLDRVKRDQFVPPAQKALAYVDMELPLGHGADQVMLAPRVQARMVQDLAIKPTDKVLEIGTGSGYTAALMASLAQRVLSLEIEPALASQAFYDDCARSLTPDGVLVVNLHSRDEGARDLRARGIPSRVGDAVNLGCQRGHFSAKVRAVVRVVGIVGSLN